MPESELMPLPGIRPEQETAEETGREMDFAPRHRVLIHNDHVTTFDYVLQILGQVFMLSTELAEHVAWTAHQEGVAVVVVRPQSEAEKLARVANNRARQDGFPLTFSTEPED